MVAQVLGEDAARDFEWGRRIAVEGGLHHRELVFVVQEELLYAPVQVVEEWSLPRKDAVRSQPAPPSQRVEVALQGPRGRAGPQPNVWGDVEQQARFLPPLVAYAE
jgi:hypothetical protein